MTDVPLLDVRLVGGKIGLPVADAAMADRAMAGEIAVLRGAFSVGEAIALRRAILAWGRISSEFPKGVSASKAFLNFHRRDEDAIGGYLPHKFHLFGFGDLAALPAEFSALLRRLADPLLDLENRLSGGRWRYDSGELKIGAARHPRGGGYTARHVHPFEPRRIAILASLSTPGVDHAEPVMVVNSRGLDLAPDMRAGDILVWRYDLPHEFRTVDPSAATDWDVDDGCWIFGPELLSSHGGSRLASTP